MSRKWRNASPVIAKEDDLFCLIPYKQKVAKGDKANHGWENTL